MKKYVVILFLLSMVAIWPFFKKGYFQSHDGEWMVIRFSAFHQTLRAGQFPVRFVDRLNNNYGYPVLNFLYPLPFYLAEVPKALGFSFVNSIKIVFAASTVASSLAMFWALSQRFSLPASFAASVLYIFIPYRFVDLYVRGSLGESLAFAAVPLCLGAIFKVAKGNKIFLPFLSLSVSTLILSHNVIAFLFLPIFVVLSLLLIKKERIRLAGHFLLGLLVASFFVLPALYDLKYVKLPQIKVGNTQDHLVDLASLVIPRWGYGPSPNGQNPLPVQIGLVPLAVFMSALYLQSRKKAEPSLRFLLVVSILCVFLMSKFSGIFWQNFRFSDLVQFPWRLLSIIVFTSSVTAAWVIDMSKNKRTLALTVAIACILSTILYTKPQTFVDRGDGFYSTNEGTTTVADEYMPLWVNAHKNSRADQKIELVGEGQIKNLNIKPSVYKAEIESPSGVIVNVNAVYFPGWQASVDDKKVPLNFANDFGLINFQLPAGKHEVIIKYTESPVATAADIVSIVAVLTTGFSFYKSWPNKKS
ncbi:MAG: YfhO family protein [Candidatus Curtissbacteria bacterium]